MRTRIALTAALILTTTTLGGDWPQWRGPERDGHADEKGLLQKWPMGGPKLLWTYKDAGSGYTAGAVVGGTVYTMGCRGDDEYMIAIDDKGKEKWATKIGPVFFFNGNQWSKGPNSTPSVDGDLIYGVGSKGILICVDKTGKEIWKVDMPAVLGAQVDPIGGGIPNFGWGFSWSPMVDGDHLIITPGGPQGLVAALDKKTGKKVWQSDKVAEQSTYASAVMAEIGGVKQVVVVTQKDVHGIAAKDGSLLWTYVHKNWGDMSCVTPVVDKDHIFVTAAKGGADLFQVTAMGGKFNTMKVYQKNTMINFHGGVVLYDGLLCGESGLRSLRGLDFMSGTQLWAAADVPAGSVTVADGMLYVLGQDTDTVYLVEAKKAGATVKGEFMLPAIGKLRLPSSKAWTHPVISDGKLYVRDQELIYCYDVTGKK